MSISQKWYVWYFKNRAETKKKKIAVKQVILIFFYFYEPILNFGCAKWTFNIPFSHFGNYPGPDYQT